MQLPITTEESQATPKQHDLLVPQTSSPQSITPVPGREGFYIRNNDLDNDTPRETGDTTSCNQSNPPIVSRVDSNISLSSLSSDSLSHTEENCFLHSYVGEDLSNQHVTTDSCPVSCPECPKLSQEFSAIQLADNNLETVNGSAKLKEPVKNVKRSSSLKKNRSLRKPRNIDVDKRPNSDKVNVLCELIQYIL